MSEDTDIFTFRPLRKYIGMYRIGGNGGLCLYFERKPKWLHRKMMQFCLGWEWKDTV